MAEFTADVQKVRDKRIKDAVCTNKHGDDWYLAAGAGCQKDYKKKCLDCGQVVAWD